MLYRRITKYGVSAFGNVKLCSKDQDAVLENKDSERKKCWVSSILPQRHKGESVMFFKNKDKFKAPQFVLNRTCKI